MLTKPQGFASLALGYRISPRWGLFGRGIQLGHELGSQPVILSARHAVPAKLRRSSVEVATKLREVARRKTSIFLEELPNLLKLRSISRVMPTAHCPPPTDH